MKRMVVVLIIAASLVGAVSAQGFGPGYGMAGQPQLAPGAQQPAPTLSTIEGKLSLVQGRVALVVKDKTYFVHIPGTLYGFIDGLKEGAQVKLEGYEMAIPYAPNSFMFQVTKLIIGSREYDLSQVGYRGGFMGGCFDGGRGMGRGGSGPGQNGPRW